MRCPLLISVCTEVSDTLNNLIMDEMQEKEGTIFCNAICVSYVVIICVPYDICPICCNVLSIALCNGIIIL